MVTVSGNLVWETETERKKKHLSATPVNRHRRQSPEVSSEPIGPFKCSQNFNAKQSTVHFFVFSELLLYIEC